MSIFEQPAPPSAGIKWADHSGALLLIEPLGVEEGISTAFGVADAVKANISVVDGAGAGETYREALIFPKLLASQTRSQVGKKVLGRLAEGVAKPGQSAPWVLNEATPADVAAAEAWLQKQTASSVVSADAPF